MNLWIDNPWWLLLLLAIPPLAAIAYRAFTVSMSTARAVSAIAARSLLIAALALALAGAASVRETDRLAVVAAIDTSGSLVRFAAADGPVAEDTPPSRLEASPTQTPLERIRDFLAAAADARRPDDLLGVVSFDASASAALAPTARRDPAIPLDAPGAEGTDIAAALRFADLIAPAGAAHRLLLVSDGAQTAGDAIEQARELASRGVPVDVLPVPFGIDREVLVEAVDLPPRAPGGGRVAVRAAIRATQPASGSVRLLYNGSPVPIAADGSTSRPVTLETGRNIVTFDVTLDEELVFHRMEAVFTPNDKDTDAIAQNNRAEAFTVTRGRGSVLVVANQADGSGRLPLERALTDAGVRVRTALPAGIPADLLSLQAYDLVILDNTPAWEVEPAAQRALVDHVSVMGGGLAMIGGETSFGAGGWKGTPLAEILPVRLDVPDEVLMSQAAVAIVLDNSGSMARGVMGGNRSQQQIANAGAAQAVRSLDARDQLMVVSFNSSPTVVVPMGPNDDPDRNAQRVGGITSGGGTRMLPAMRIAGDELLRVDAKVKHMIMLTDGQSEEGNAEMARLAGQLAREGITVTTIAVGNAADTQTLQLIATNGEGAFYRVDDPRVLPSIFVKEVSVVRRPLVREGAFKPAIADPASPLILGVDGFQSPAGIPPLSGIVLSRPKDDPKITYALTDGDGYPLLAHWFVGRGRVAAFTSDARRAGWARNWIDNPAWPGFDALAEQIASFIARPPLSSNAELTTRIEGDDLIIEYTALDDQGRPIDNLDIDGTLTAPNGETSAIDLNQTAPGRYEARQPANDRGNYVVALDAAPSGAARSSLVVGGATKAIGAEQRQLRSDTNLLLRIADITGGRVLDFSAESVTNMWQRQNLSPARASTPLWPALIAASLVIFTLDVGTRRLAWDRLLSREVVAEVSRHAASSAARRAEAASATASGLRERFTARAAKDPPPAPIAARQTTQTTTRASRPTESDEENEAAQRAAEIRKRQQARKEKLRREAISSLAGTAKPNADTPSRLTPGRDRDATESPTDENTPAATEGLLAAKKRAAERRRGRDIDDR